jgi:hypothetical protein
MDSEVLNLKNKSWNRQQKEREIKTEQRHKKELKKNNKMKAIPVVTVNRERR